MKIIPEPIKDWFGFTRRERRSSFILLLIIVVIICFRYTFPEHNMEIEDMTASYAAIMNSEKENNIEARLFPFDPNITSFDTLISLGLTEKEAATMVSYRKKGGRFNKPEDLRKIYGIDESKAARLIPYVVVATVPGEHVKTDTIPKQKIMIELNTCDSASLIRLPGIGPVLSGRIIKYRKLLGSYVRTDQLREVYGLPAETYDLVKGNLYVDTTKIARTNINTAGYKELSRIPYLEKYEVSSILKYRELNGKIGNINVLCENKLVSAEKAEKIRLYFLFE